LGEFIEEEDEDEFDLKEMERKNVKGETYWIHPLVSLPSYDFIEMFP